MSDTQTWWVEGHILGSAPSRLERTHNEMHRAQSYAFCCPCCGEVWARRIVSPPTKWFFWTGCCRKCADKNPNRLHTPGSIWQSWSPEYLANLPDFMLRYEARNCLEFLNYPRST